MDKMCHLLDDELVDLYVTGCNEAFDELLYRYKDRLFDYITYNLGPQQSLADDVFQETFVKVIVTLKNERYFKAGYFFSWLTRIAHNIIMDIYRQDAQLNVVTDSNAEAGLLNNAQIVDSYCEAQIINEQTLNDVKKLMEHLPQTQREVVFMRFYENRSFKEIADLTGVSINTSLGRMRYALLNMRKMAEDYGISLEMI